MNTEERRAYHAKPEMKAKRIAYKKTARGKDAARSSALKCRYGITLDQRDELLRAQEGKCMLPHCRQPVAFGRGFSKTTAHLDHCHTTGRIRGVLCGACNTAIGRLGDTVESLQAVVDYLQRTQ